MKINANVEWKPCVWFLLFLKRVLSFTSDLGFLQFCCQGRMRWEAKNRKARLPNLKLVFVCSSLAHSLLSCEPRRKVVPYRSLSLPTTLFGSSPLVKVRTRCKSLLCWLNLLLCCINCVHVVRNSVMLACLLFSLLLFVIRGILAWTTIIITVTFHRFIIMEASYLFPSSSLRVRLFYSDSVLICFWLLFRP